MELDILLQNVVRSAPSLKASWGFSFDLMYRTGIRHEELDLDRWSIFSSDCFILDCAKHSETRLISFESLGSELVDFIRDRSKVMFCTSRSTLTRAFMRCSYPYRLMHESDNVFLHSFRFNFVKKLCKSGLSVEQIKTIIGHKDIKNTKIYVNKTIQILSL